MGRGLLLTALALGLASAPPAAADARRQLQEVGTPGTCIYTYAVSGYDFEDNQDETSLQVKCSCCRSAPLVVPLVIGWAPRSQTRWADTDSSGGFVATSVLLLKSTNQHTSRRQIPIRTICLSRHPPA